MLAWRRSLNLDARGRMRSGEGLPVLALRIHSVHNGKLAARAGRVCRLSFLPRMMLHVFQGWLPGTALGRY